jgi:hypothetical protein
VTQAAVFNSYSDHDQIAKVVGEDHNAFLHAIDEHAGKPLRTLRLLLSMMQSQLGNACGLVFQQIQKYERGSNRISAQQDGFINSLTCSAWISASFSKICRRNCISAWR